MSHTFDFIDIDYVIVCNVPTFNVDLINNVLQATLNLMPFFNLTLLSIHSLVSYHRIILFREGLGLKIYFDKQSFPK